LKVYNHVFAKPDKSKKIWKNIYIQIHTQIYTYTDTYKNRYIQTEAQIHYTTKQYLQTLDSVATLQSPCVSTVYGP